MGKIHASILTHHRNKERCFEISTSITASTTCKEWKPSAHKWISQINKSPPKLKCWIWTMKTQNHISTETNQSSARHRVSLSLYGWFFNNKNFKKNGEWIMISNQRWRNASNESNKDMHKPNLRKQHVTTKQHSKGVTCANFH